MVESRWSSSDAGGNQLSVMLLPTLGPKQDLRNQNLQKL